MLETVEAILDEIGGEAQAALLCGVGISAVSNWKARKSIPADKFLALSRALADRGKPEPDPAVFAFRPAEVRA